MAPAPSCPLQPPEDLDSVWFPSLDTLTRECDEIRIIDDKLRLLQGKWLGEAQAWLTAQRGELPQLPLIAEALEADAFHSAGEPSSRQMSPASSSASRHVTPSVASREHRAKRHAKEPKSQASMELGRFQFRSESTTANADPDDSFKKKMSQSSVKALKDIDERTRAAALTASISCAKSVSNSSMETSSSRDKSLKDKMQQRLLCFTQSLGFKSFIVVAIFSNVVFVGIEVEHLAHTKEKDDIKIFETIQLCYTVIFFIELVFRLLAEGVYFFIGRRNMLWNWFDFFIVCCAIVEAVASNAVDVTHFRIMRIIRVTRLLRTMRVLKMVRFVRALRTLVQSIAATLRHVVWSLILLLMILYGFGVAFAQAVIDACGITAQEVSGVCDSDDLGVYWGTLPKSMYTLYKSVSGGINWGEVTHDLGMISSAWVGLFLVYLTFTLFAVLNVVTGVFCQSAIESVQEDKEMAAMQLMANKGVYLEALDQLFDEIDTDHSDMITLDEFEGSLEHEKVQAYFQSLEISSTDAWALFKLLDADGSGSIDRDEFLMGCIQFRGGAKAVDIAKMAYENKVIFNMLEDCMTHFDEQLSVVLANVREVVSGIGKQPVDGGPSTGLLIPSHSKFSQMGTVTPKTTMIEARKESSEGTLNSSEGKKRSSDKKETISRPQQISEDERANGADRNADKNADRASRDSDRKGSYFSKKRGFSKYELTPQHKQGLEYVLHKDDPRRIEA